MDILARLVVRPPRVLLLEGGSAGEREKLALYWAALLNCTAAPSFPASPRAESGLPHSGPSLPGPRPCEQCPACNRIRDGVFLDLIYMDGREGRIGIDMIRELRSVLGQAPRDAKRRVIVLGEAQELTDEAANALLKSMEDTETRNAYILLAPQRERLLPTLVSRSWTATLSWDLDAGRTDAGRADVDLERAGLPGAATQKDDHEGIGQAEAEWVDALARFLATGRGWFARTMVKGQVDRPLAYQLILASRRSLITACQGRPDTALARLFCERGHPRAWRAIDLRLDDAELALRTQVAPALVLDWLAVGLRQALGR